jgi:hypothetical protein
MWLLYYIYHIIIKHYYRINIILWRIDPLLSGDSVYNDRFWATARGQHVPAATNTHETKGLLLETGCFYVVETWPLNLSQYEKPANILVNIYNKNNRSFPRINVL